MAIGICLVSLVDVPAILDPTDLTFPTIQLPLFVIPNGTPSFVLLAGVFGILQLLMGVVVRERASRYAAPSQ